MSDSYSSLGERLEGLLQVEKFPPPAGFAARAQVRDPAVYEQAAADPAAWWADAGAAAAALGHAVLARCSTTATRRSTPGSPTGPSTCPTTASTGMCWPATATGSRSTGGARRARNAT